MPAQTRTLELTHGMGLQRDPLWDPYRRYSLYDQFRFRPALNAVTVLPGSDSTSPTAAAFLAYLKANKEWEVGGSNMTTTLCTFSAAGGITITTAGGANTTDSAWCVPLVSTGQVSGWGANTWLPSRQPFFRCHIQTHSAIVAQKLHIGLKKTANISTATDDDQVGFQFSTTGSSSTAWSLFQSVGNVDTAPTLLAGAPLVAASTEYELAIAIDELRIPHFYINRRLVGVGTPMTATATAGTWASLAPVFSCIQMTNSVAAAMTIRDVQMSVVQRGFGIAGVDGGGVGAATVPIGFPGGGGGVGGTS